MIQRRAYLLRLKSFIFAILLCTPLYVLAYTSPGNPTGFVDDFAHVLTTEQKNSLERKLSTFNASTTNEVAVVLVKSLEGDYIEHYASLLFKEWQIGTGKHNNGVLLLVALDDHKARIEVGYGLEGALTDTISAKIIRDDITPAFKQNDFYGGIDKATDDIIKVTQGEYLSTSSKPSSIGNFLEKNSGLVFFFFIFAIQGITFIASIFARSKSWWAGGVVGGLLGGGFTFFGLFGVSFFLGSIVTIIFTLLGLLFDYIVSSTYTQSVTRGSSIPWWVGGRGFGGGGSSGSSFGGFGGGSSGGGGASGSW
jgi:uncharacterized protein